MHLYIDESGSINNHNAAHCPYFVIAIVHVKDKEKAQKHISALYPAILSGFRNWINLN